MVSALAGQAKAEGENFSIKKLIGFSISRLAMLTSNYDLFEVSHLNVVPSSKDSSLFGIINC